MPAFFENYEVKNHSSFKIGGRVKKAAAPCSLKELIQLLNSGGYDYVFGSCSNILFSSSDINKNVIFTEKLSDFSIEGSRVKVLCGAKGAAVSRHCCREGLSGLEFLIGFPGSFGGIICMNASAHGQTAADCLISAEIYDAETHSVKILSKEELGFTYRNSLISKKNYTVLSAEFELKRSKPEIISETMKHNIEFRKLHQPPLIYPNAGSIFKNPENNSAGRLLDLCGMKGVKEGGAGVFENHANFIINTGGASSLDVLKLMYKMFSKVKEEYKIELRPEIKYIGSSAQEAELWSILTGNTL